MKCKLLVRVLGIGLAATSISAVTAAAASANETITGAGSTLVAPLAEEWASAFEAQNPTITVNYSSVGSGAGLTDIGKGLVDFGASDAPLSASSTPCSGCKQMPWALSAVGIAFHINGLKTLRLTGPVIAKIYLGQIKNWDNPQIRRLQKKGVHLPNLPISVFFRSDGSGTTYAFANYESDIDSAFRSRIGDGTSLNWPVGTGADGNAGMTAAVKATNGGIAYIEVSYLIANFPRAAAVKNAAGNWEVPNYSNIAEAAKSVNSLPSDNEIHIVDPPKRYKTAYPISSYTYVIMRPNDPANGLVKDFIKYALTTGQSLGPRLGFVPIPKFVKQRDESTLSSF